MKKAPVHACGRGCPSILGGVVSPFSFLGGSSWVSGISSRGFWRSPFFFVNLSGGLMAYFSRLILLILSFAYSYSHAYDATGIAEGAPFTLARSSSVEVYTVGNGVTVWSTNLGPGSYRCDSTLWGADPAYGKSKGCRFTAQACEAPTVWNPETSQCEPPPPPECNPNQELDPETNTCVCIHTNGGSAGSFAVPGDVFVGCNNGCEIVLKGGSYSSVTNKTYGWWSQNGESCTPNPDKPPSDPPDSPSGQDAGKCPTGQCPGYLNGTFMCVPCKGKESSSSSSSESSDHTPNGASSPQSSESSSENGSKNTQCEGGQCVTTEKVIIRNPDGSTTEKDKTTSEPQSDFCAKNPKAAICKAADDSSWSGSCDGGFVAKGDAVQIATAKAAWEMRCASNQGADQATEDTMNSLKTWSMSDLNLPDLTVTAPTPEASTCPLGDISANFGQFTVSLPLSMVCPYLAVIHKVVTSFGSLMWLLIVFVRGK